MVGIIPTARPDVHPRTASYRKIPRSAEVYIEATPPLTPPDDRVNVIVGAAGAMSGPDIAGRTL